MKRFFIIINLMLTFITQFIIPVQAEQYVLACKIKISAIHMVTNKVLRSYMIDRYFIIDTVLAGVYDANNLPLDVNEFNDAEIIFTKRQASFADIVDTRLTYNRGTRKITLNEIYAYASKFDQRARFYTKGEGTCQEIKINRKPLF